MSNAMLRTRSASDVTPAVAQTSNARVLWFAATLMLWKTLQYFRRSLRDSALFAAHIVGFRQAESTIAADSQRYWSNTSQRSFRSDSHWRGEGGLSEETWLALGQFHFDLFNDLRRTTALAPPLQRVIEWGCGGGSNAAPFSKIAEQFIGVDVSQASLDECGKTLRDAGRPDYLPILIDVADPEGALARVPEPCDLFLCTYVFELIPTPEYGRRLMQVAHRLLRPGGLAFIQIKYSTTLRTRSRGFGYQFHLASMTTYPIDGFWELATNVGFVPKAVYLLPKEPLVHDERYAYYLLERPAS